jgi:flavin reductase (DIM6/NTAB) family NADH-FMN oxidoreductase RutF
MPHSEQRLANFDQITPLDNFYQTSSFFPMPVVAISTLSESGQTNVGPYSLVFPYYIAGKEHYTMLLLVRNNSNTAMNILRTGKCALNFLPDDNKYMKECVRLGFPGEITSDKMKETIFTLQKGMSEQTDHGEQFPEIIKEAYQVFECTWLSDLEGADKQIQEVGIQTDGYDDVIKTYNNFNGITSNMGAHFILRIDHILIKPEYKKAIVDGVNPKAFPKVPIDYGYRDNTNFWFQSFSKPYAEKIPETKAVQVDTVQYAADRLDTQVKFTKEACAQLVKVPRVFLKAALKGCVDWAEKNNVILLTAEHMDKIRDKRNAEKKNS